MRIAAYCRVSTDSEKQLDSLEHQKEFFEEYARKNGHDLVMLYADGGISGTSLKKRDEFMRMMNDAKLGIFETLVVKDVSRLARNTVDFLQSIRMLKSLKINTVFITANMDSLGESEFVLTLFGAMAQEESANLSKRVKFGKKINAQKGRVPQRIFGYDRVDNFTLRIDSSEAVIVREIFRLYIEEGLGCRTLSIKLNSMGYKTKFGCEWNPRGVRRVLVNSIYCGRFVNNKYETEDYLTGKRINIPPERNYYHDRPEWAIVTPETFEKAQAILESRRKKYETEESSVQSRYSGKHLFSTMIKCEHCRRSFCRKSVKYVNERIYWKCVTNDQFTAEKCGNKVKLDEPELIRALREYFALFVKDRDALIKSVIEEIEKQVPIDNAIPDAGETRKKRKQLMKKKERYQEMYAADIITMTELKAKTEAIMSKLNELERSLKQTERMSRVGEKDRANEYIKEIDGLLSMAAFTNVDLRKIIDHINVNMDGTVTVHIKNLGGD